MDDARKALIIANGEYEHADLKNLSAPEADAAALQAVLGDRRISDFQVRVVRNETSHVIQAEIEDLFLDCGSDDVLLLHFSCHGLKNDANELFFAARNTRPNRLGSTAVPASFIQRCLRTSRSRSVVLLLDCCYSKAFGEGVTVRAAGDVNVLDSFPAERLGGGRGRAVITAAGSTEFAFEDARPTEAHQAPRPSVFTSALVEGLATGAADRDEDGLISLNELYDYVFDRVREHNPNQTPSRDIEMQGELYLARSTRRRIHPLPVPPDLRAAMTDANMFTRLGALAELQARLASENLPVAAGALEALRSMADTDIQHVADRAAAALSSAVPRPAEPDIRFGPVPQGSIPPRRTVRLLGPPLARACTVDTAHGWIKLTQTDDGIDVVLDTTQAGRLQGTIALSCLTGDAVISVHAEITPAVSRAEPVRPPNQAVSPEPATVTAARPVPPSPPRTPEAAAPTPARTVTATVAGLVTVAAAGLILVGQFPGYVDDESNSLAANPGWSSWYPVLMTAAALAACLFLFAGAGKRLIGTGLLVGVAAAGAGWLVFVLGSIIAYPYATLFAGFWLELIGHLALVAGAGIALGSARKERLVRFARGLLKGWTPWLMVSLGGAGALALLGHLGQLYELASNDYFSARDAVAFWMAPTVAALIAAALVPLFAAVATPRSFAISLVAGWVMGGWGVAALDIAALSSYEAEQSAILFAVTLLALAGVALKSALAGRQTPAPKR